MKSAQIVKGPLVSAGLVCKRLTVRFSEVSLILSDLLGLLQIIESPDQITLWIMVDRAEPCALQQLALVGCVYELGPI
jgi:hypothetical protein